MAKIGPIVLTVIGDNLLQACRISAIIWEGSSTAGDTVELRDPTTNVLLWPGRTDSTNTYLGANLGPEGIHCPNGFKLQQISSGRLCVYVREN